MRPNSLHGLLQPLVGQPCTQVGNSVGSILLIDIGPPGREPLQPEISRPQGWRSLLIDSPWRLQTATEVICDWNAESGRGGELARCVSRLEGRVVTAVRVDPPAWDLRIQFGELELIVFCDRDVDREYAWAMTGLDGIGLVVGPGLPPPGWNVAWRTID